MGALGVGPSPKPEDQRARRNKPSNANMLLPSEGRSGPPPEWPVGMSEQSLVQLAIWEELWALPQAVAWERMRIVREVARYVCFLTTGETIANNAETRQMADRLGLNPLSMRRLGWDIVETEVGSRAPTASTANRYAGLRTVKGEDD